MRRKRPDCPVDTLIIDRNSSWCNACGEGADPSEKSHKRVIEYSPDSGRPGCGTEWRFVSTNYMGQSQEEGVKMMRPDLKFVPIPLPVSS